MVWHRVLGPQLPVGDYLIHPLDLVENYQPRGEYHLTTGLVMANPQTLGRSYNEGEFEAWRRTFCRRFQGFGGWAEILGTSVGMGGLMNLGLRQTTHLLTPLIGGLVSRGIHSPWVPFLITTSLLSTFVAGAMTLWNITLRGESAPGQTPWRQWLTGIAYTLPSMLLGMGLMYRWAFGRRFWQDLLLEPVQAVFSVAVGRGLEATGLAPESKMTAGERWVVEVAEGALFMIAGRSIGPLSNIGLTHHTGSIPTPRPVDFQIVRSPLGSGPGPFILERRVLMAGRPRTARPPLRSEQIPHLVDCLGNRDAATRMTTAGLLVEAYRRFPDRRGGIEQVLIRRLGYERDAAVRERFVAALREMKKIGEKRRLVRIDDDLLVESFRRVLEGNEVRRLLAEARSGRGRPVRPRTVANLAYTDYCAHLPPRARRPRLDVFRERVIGERAEPRVMELLAAHGIEKEVQIPIDRGRVRREAQAEIAALRAQGVTEIRLADLLRRIYEKVYGSIPEAERPGFKSVRRLIDGPEREQDEELLRILDEGGVKRQRRVKIEPRIGRAALEQAERELVQRAAQRRRPVDWVATPRAIASRARELYCQAQGLDPSQAPTREAFRKLYVRLRGPAEPVRPWRPDGRLFMAASGGGGSLYQELRHRRPDRRQAAIERLARRLQGEARDNEAQRLLAQQLESERNHRLVVKIAEVLLPHMLRDLSHREPHRRFNAVSALARIHTACPSRRPAIRAALEARLEEGVEEDFTVREYARERLQYLERRVRVQSLAPEDGAPRREVARRLREAIRRSRRTLDEIATDVGCTSFALRQLLACRTRTPTLKMVYGLCQVFHEGVDPRPLYDLYNRELKTLPFFDGEQGRLVIDVPKGCSFGEVLEGGPRAFIRRRLAELSLSAQSLQKTTDLSYRTINHLIYGDVRNPSLLVCRAMATGLKLPEGLVYVVLHPEVVDFYPVAWCDTGEILFHPSGEYRFETYVARFRPAVGSGGSARLLAVATTSFGQSGLKHVAWRYLRTDAASERPYLVLPKGWTEARIDELDMKQELARVAQGEGQDRRLQRFGVTWTQFGQFARAEIFPALRTLKRIARVVELPTEVVIAWRVMHGKEARPFDIRGAAP